MNPAFVRLAEKAWKFFAGSGMYGRETLVGYQKLDLHAAACSPAALRSARDLAGLYGYCLTLFAYPNRLGGWNSFATTPRPP